MAGRSADDSWKELAPGKDQDTSLSWIDCGRLQGSDSEEPCTEQREKEPEKVKKARVKEYVLKRMKKKKRKESLVGHEASIYTLTRAED